VVVGIIALLVTILMPSLGRARELARRVICATNLRGLGTAWRIYFFDNNNADGTMGTSPVRYLLRAEAKEEEEFRYLMRLRRSYELAQNHDED